MIDLDEIRKRVAIENNLLLGENDPLIAIPVIVDEILEQSVSELNTQQEANVKALLNAIQQGHVEAKKTASKIINEASGYVSDQANNAISSAMSEGREEIRKDLRLAVAKIEEARKAAVFAAGVSFGCAILALGSLWFTVT